MMTEMALVKKAVSKVFGDFVAKVVNDGVDVLKSAIKDADSDRKSFNQNLQTRLYQLIVDALNRFTYNKYEKQDKLYAAAESILKGYISTQDDIDAVKSGLKMLVSDVNSDTCQDFLEILCGEICRDDNSDLYKEFDMLWKRQESEHFRGEFAKVDQNDREILEQLNDLKKVLDFIRKNMNRQEGDKPEHNGISIVNRADEYAKKWDKNVFLNNFNEEDENAGVNIKLRELYKEGCLPHYIWKNNTKTSDKLRNLLTKYIINNSDRKMLLILGQPGIGKSTLITWIMANLVENKKNILIYQFATDLDSIDWQRKNILKGIFSEIGLGIDELEGKTLILDGFDEVYIGSDRERILNKLNQDLKGLNTLKSFSMIITCRENYVYNLQYLVCDYIVLQAWNEAQIENFCRTYWEKCGNDISEDTIQKTLENKDIFGIPLILYMILALNIAIEKNSSMVDVYDQIFSLEKGAIYDRRYDSEHRINNPEIKEHIYRISQKIAFWMFENNADKAFISQEKFEEICDNEIRKYSEGDKNIQSDILIGNFFRLKHSEGKGTDELQFVHRSIYEYFVAKYFFDSVSKLMSKEDIAGTLGELLKDGRLTIQILEFIKYEFEGMEKFNISCVINETFKMMLQNGMTYYVETKYNNIIEREMNVFTNMLAVAHLWNFDWGEIPERIITYLQHNQQDALVLDGIRLNGKNNSINLSGIYLEGASLEKANLEKVILIGADLLLTNLAGVNLAGACLRGAFLQGANLEGANLRDIDLSEANLEGAYFVGADLDGIDLRDSNLHATIFDERQILLLQERYDLSKSRIYIFETKDIVAYENYCIIYG